MAARSPACVPDDLAAHALTGLLERTPALDPAEIDDVLLGDANAAGEDNRDVARMAVLLAGLPTSIPGVTVNRLCGSSLEASIQGARTIETGDASIVVAGGVESMSRAPWVLLKPERRVPGDPPGAVLDHARLAHGQPGDAGAVDDLARAQRREARRDVLDLARRAGRLRAALAPAGRRGVGGRRLRGRDRRRAGRRAGARRGHPRRTPRWRSSPSSSRRSWTAAR